MGRRCRIIANQSDYWRINENWAFDLTQFILIAVARPIAKKIVERIKVLADNPRPDGCKKLTGASHAYRIRINDFRVVYSITDQRLIIEVIKVGHRKDIYQ